jgi:2-polyprenyl-3-methyl-5-hydroxy-6-metoxy-1,4-benzoquinol methylase
LSPFNPGRSPACEIDVVRCSGCGLYRLDPRLDDDSLEEIQTRTLGDAEGEVGSFETGNVNRDYPELVARELTQTGFPARGGRLLDVGCGSGDLVAATARLLSATAAGLEMGEASVRRARRRFPEHDWVCGKIEPGVVAGTPYDAAMLVHVLEHLSDPVGDLGVIGDWLKPGGLLFIEVPNGEFYFSRFYSLLLESPKPLVAAVLRSRGRRVPFTSRGFYPFHLTLFGLRTLPALVRKAGFEVLHTRISTCRLEFWLGQNRRDRDWARWTINRIKLGLARAGLGDNLLLVARRPGSPPGA